MPGNVIIPSLPEDKKKVQGAISEISNALTRIEAERDFINDTLAMLEEEFELPKKYMRKVSRVYHKQNLNEVREEFSDIEDIYTNVIV